MSDRDQFLDGASVPWDFLVPKTTPRSELPLVVDRTPQQTRRRLIAAGRWRRP